MISKFQTLICIVALLIAGCSPRAIKDPREVAGEYIFKYRTGEMEVLLLREDLSYQQELYSDIDNYRSHATPSFTNSGTWSYGGIGLTMNKFFNFCDFPNPEKRLDPPVRSQSTPAFWQRPSSKWNAFIVFSEDSGYALLRVKNRADVK